MIGRALPCRFDIGAQGKGGQRIMAGLEKETPSVEVEGLVGGTDGGVTAG